MTQMDMGAAGALDLHFSVDSSGSATCDVALDLPPALAGVAPVLSLRYESGGPDGPLGVGWSLEGLSVIERADDGLALDGQRLIAAGSVYFTELERWSQVRPRCSPGGDARDPLSFTVTTSEGLRMDYGTTPSARVVGACGACAWLLDEVMDPHGNAYRVRYSEGHPSEIQFTSNEAAGLTPPCKVVFEYDARSGASGRRLRSISTYADGEPIWVYEMEYDQASDGRLVSVTESDAHGRAIPSTRFGWREDGLMTSITGGLGGRIQIAYAPLSDGALSGHVVCEYVFDDARGGGYRRAVSYERGPEFTSLKVTDLDAGWVAETIFHQAFPLLGATRSSTLRRLEDGALLWTKELAYVVAAGAVPSTKDVQIARAETVLHAHGAPSEVWTAEYRYERGRCVSVREAVRLAGDALPSWALYTAEAYDHGIERGSLFAARRRVELRASDEAGEILTRLELDYDARGRVVTSRSFQAKTCLTAQYEYDPCGNPISIRESTGAATTIEYDDTRRFPVAVTVDGQRTTRTFSSKFGLLLSEVGPDGAQRRQAVDSLGLKSACSGPGPDGLTAFLLEEYTFGFEGEVFYEQVTTTRGDAEPGERSWRRTYRDGLGRAFRTATFDPDRVPPLVEQEIDRAHDPIAGCRPAPTQRAYDLSGRLVFATAHARRYGSGVQDVVPTDTLGSGSRADLSMFGRFVGHQLVRQLGHGLLTVSADPIARG